MNTEKHYADGGEPHYKRVARLGLSWCRANITKYAERTKGTPIDDLIKVADYAIMELEEPAVMTVTHLNKLKAVSARLDQLIIYHSKPGDSPVTISSPQFTATGEIIGVIEYPPISDGSDAVARGYVNQGGDMYDGYKPKPLYAGNEERRK